ncbi:MAG TPA: NADH-ubiquinone oxidoreductase-F iron-sulfur binding region domain-containing protein [Acidimicrobiia bacterium]|nr:NADH-ubiquinone oxidoreductase-F iron-sulfur binding region domain-containing protein [Acidimicrobiia bacterium]
MTGAATDTARRGAPPEGLPRLLETWRPDGPVRYAEHVARYGPPPWRGRRRGAQPELVGMLEYAGLRGRGGAGFPVARKLLTVARARGGKPVVLANASEGEPASRKDKLLLAGLPHLVLDGAALAADAVGSDEVVVAVDRWARDAVMGISHAIDERAALRCDPVTFRLAYLPARFVAGEETAVVNFVNGGPAKPTFVPPRPFEKGVFGRPTLVQNAETLAHVALVARFGADWYTGVGARDEPGTALVTVSGAVARPCVVEIAIGTPIGDVVVAAGGVTESLSAILVGGYYGRWIDALDAWDAPMSRAGLAPFGANPGCGVIHALPAGACGLVASARIARYLAEETAGQCGPCVNGLHAIATAVEQLARGTHDRDTLARLRRWCDQVDGRGACRYPDGAVRFVRSALEVFADEIDEHTRHGRCRANRPHDLPLPNPATRDWEWR